MFPIAPDGCSKLVESCKDPQDDDDIKSDDEFKAKQLAEKCREIFQQELDIRLLTPGIDEGEESWSWSDIKISSVVFLILIHLFATIGLWSIVHPSSWDNFTGLQTPRTSSLVYTFFFAWCAGFGITAGVHRLWSHKSYQACFAFRFVLMVFNSMAFMGSIHHWARDHRVHHLYSDTDKDPHNAHRGFFYSHIGWLFFNKSKSVIDAGKTIDMSDLEADPVVMFQKKYYLFWSLWWCFGFGPLVTWLLGDSWTNGFCLCCLRWVYIYHCTATVNSLAHGFGSSRPYSPTHLTVQQPLVAFLAVGEGWHNYHHAFPFDYATAELDWYQQWNPTKLFLDICASLGLIWNCKRADRIWANRRRHYIKKYGKDIVRGVTGPPFFRHVETDYELMTDAFGKHKAR